MADTQNNHPSDLDSSRPLNDQRAHTASDAAIDKKVPIESFDFSDVFNGTTPLREATIDSLANMITVEAPIDVDQAPDSIWVCACASPEKGRNFLTYVNIDRMPPELQRVVGTYLSQIRTSKHDDVSSRTRALMFKNAVGKLLLACERMVSANQSMNGGE